MGATRIRAVAAVILFLFVFAALSVCAEEEYEEIENISVELSCDNREGGEVDICVALPQNQGFCGIFLVLKYDRTAFSFSGAHTDAVGINFSFCDTEEGVRILFDCTENHYMTGVIATVSFEVKDGGEEKEEGYVFSLSREIESVACRLDKDGRLIPLDVTSNGVQTSIGEGPSQDHVQSEVPYITLQSFLLLDTPDDPSVSKPSDALLDLGSKQNAREYRISADLSGGIIAGFKIFVVDSASASTETLYIMRAVCSDTVTAAVSMPEGRFCVVITPILCHGRNLVTGQKQVYFVDKSQY